MLSGLREVGRNKDRKRKCTSLYEVLEPSQVHSNDIDYKHNLQEADRPRIYFEWLNSSLSELRINCTKCNIDN